MGLEESLTHGHRVRSTHDREFLFETIQIHFVKSGFQSIITLSIVTYYILYFTDSYLNI